MRFASALAPSTPTVVGLYTSSPPRRNVAAGLTKLRRRELDAPVSFNVRVITSTARWLRRSWLSRIDVSFAASHKGVRGVARSKATRIIRAACVNAATSAMSAFEFSELAELCLGVALSADLPPTRKGSRFGNASGFPKSVTSVKTGKDWHRSLTAISPIIWSQPFGRNP